MKRKSQQRGRMPKKCNNLDTMPQVVIERILKDCDLMDILSLRKTCWHTRRLIDTIRPDPRIKRIIFTCSPETVSMILTLTDSRWRKVTYENRCSGWSSMFTNTTAAEMFRQDFKTLLPMITRQKTPLAECDLVIFENSMPVFQESMARLLDEFSTQLRIEHLTITYHGDLDLMSVLSFVCATSLEIEDKNRRFEVLDMSRVAELDQWKSLRKLTLTGCRLDILPHLSQLSDMWLDYQTASPEDIIALKDVFRKSPTANKWDINTKDQRHWNEIKREMTQSPTRESVLYFLMSTPGCVMRIKFLANISFTRISMSELNGDVLLHDF